MYRSVVYVYEVLFLNRRNMRLNCDMVVFSVVSVRHSFYPQLDLPTLFLAHDHPHTQVPVVSLKFY